MLTIVTKNSILDVARFLNPNLTITNIFLILETDYSFGNFQKHCSPCEAYSILFLGATSASDILTWVLKKKNQYFKRSNMASVRGCK